MMRELESVLMARLTTDAKFTKPVSVVPENILKSTQVQPVAFQRITVPVTMQLPDEWLATATAPCINIWRVEERQTMEQGWFRPANKQTRNHPLDDGSGDDPNAVDIKQHQLPVILLYEVGVLTRFEAHKVDILRQIGQRLPFAGFGTQFDVPTDDGIIQVPFRRVDYHEMTPDEVSGERMLEVRVTYEMRAWFDADVWATEKRVRTVTVRTYADQVLVNTDTLT